MSPIDNSLPPAGRKLVEKFTTGQARVGVIGLGIMGGAMSANLLKDGFRVVGFDVDMAMRDALVERGGEAADSPAAVAREADIIISSLPSPPLEPIAK